MKGIIILGFSEDSKLHIDTQFPSNLSEFLGLNSKLLGVLADLHVQHKIEPHIIETKLNDELEVISFYSGFSFRHYVGKPNFAISVFLSEGDEISDDIEGMLRRLAHELLPKRETLNFDDILGQYYEMLKREEITPYWEEIVEGEPSPISKKVKTKQEQKFIESEKEQPHPEDKEDLDEREKLVEEKNKETQQLQELLEEKMGKIRELSKKFTDLTTEKNSLLDQIKVLKEQLNEQYEKLDNRSKQISDLNDNNLKLMDDIKSLNKKVKSQDQIISEKEEKIHNLQEKLRGTEVVKKEAEKITQEKENLLHTEQKLNTEIKVLSNQLKTAENEIEKIKNQNSVHIDSITNLKMEIKKLKDAELEKEKERDQFKNQIFDLKKEIKVLRRERDHYQKIVKDNKLL